MGFCNGFDVAGYANRGGYLHNPGRPSVNAGGGWGHRHWYYATGLPGWMRGGRNFAAPYRDASVSAPAASHFDEMEMLRGEAAYFEEVLADIRERISKLETVADTEENQTGG
jgi:hypothetical protein